MKIMRFRSRSTSSISILMHSVCTFYRCWFEFKWSWHVSHCIFLQLTDEFESNCMYQNNRFNRFIAVVLIYSQRLKLCSFVGNRNPTNSHSQHFNHERCIFDLRFFGQLILCAFEHLSGLFAMIYTSVLLSCADILEMTSISEQMQRKKSIPMLRFTRNHETMTMVMHSVALETFFRMFSLFATLAMLFYLRVRSNVGKPKSSTSEVISVVIFQIDRTNSIWSNNNNQCHE